MNGFTDPQRAALAVITNVVGDERGSPEARLMAVLHITNVALLRECPAPCPICIAGEVIARER